MFTLCLSSPKSRRFDAAWNPYMTRARFEDVVVRRPDLRIPVPAALHHTADGQTVLALTRRAKYLVAESVVGRDAADAPWHVRLVSRRAHAAAQSGRHGRRPLTITSSSACRRAPL